MQLSPQWSDKTEIDTDKKNEAPQYEGIQIRHRDITLSGGHGPRDRLHPRNPTLIRDWLMLKRWLKTPKLTENNIVLKVKSTRNCWKRSSEGELVDFRQHKHLRVHISKDETFCLSYACGQRMLLKGLFTNHLDRAHRCIIRLVSTKAVLSLLLRTCSSFETHSSMSMLLEPCFC